MCILIQDYSISDCTVIYSDSRTNLYSAECYDRHVQYYQYKEGDTVWRRQ